MDIMGYIMEFIQTEEIINLFKYNDLEFSITNGVVKLLNNKNKKIERMKISLDSNTNRLHFQGNTIAFSLNHDKDNVIYLERLIMGNLDNDEIKFIMQDKIDNNEEIIEINFTDNNNNNHCFTLKEDSLVIEKATLIIQYLISKDNDLDFTKDINDMIKGKQQFSYFSFYKSNDGKIKSTGIPKECYYEFIELEKICPYMNNYLATKIPFIKKCTAIAIENKDLVKEITDEEEKTKVYTIKKSKPFYRKDINETIARANRREFKTINPKEDNN